MYLLCLLVFIGSKIEFLDLVTDLVTSVSFDGIILYNDCNV